MNTHASLFSVTSALVTSAIALTACVSADEAPGAEGEPADWVPLMTAEWTAAAGVEKSVCIRHTVSEDVTFGAIHVVSPPQAQHVMVTVGAADGPDGVVACEPLQGHERLLYAAGPMSDPFVLPDKVGMEVPAGRQLLLNVQIANPAPVAEPASLHVYVEPLDPREVTDLAEAVLMGHEAGSGPSVCTMGHDSFPFAVALQASPASHVTMVAKSSFSGEVTLFDAPTVDPQVHLLDGPVGMREGELIELRCTDDALAGSRVGATSADEGSCLAAVYRYPARPDTSWWCED